MNYCVVRYITSTILLILFGIQAGSRSQYYPPSDPSYSLVSRATTAGSQNDPNRNTNYFNTRSYQPPYRQHQHHYHIFNDPLGVTTTIRYFGTRAPIEIPRNVEVIFDDVSHDTAESLASYRRGYNRRPTTEIPELRQFDTPGIEFNDGQIDIFRNIAGRPAEVETGSMERPLETIVVVIYRPSMHSVPKCPENFRRYRSDGVCYQSGLRGPCGEKMIFYPDQENDKYGTCDCDGTALRPIAWWRPHDRCYSLYQRGPCHYNHWLILDGNGVPLCAPRKCGQDDDTDKENNDILNREFWFLYKGRCYKTGQYWPRFCEVGQEEFKVWFEMGATGASKPKCLRQMPELLKNRGLLAPVNDLPCKPGHKKMLNGECKRTARFDEDY